MLHQKQRFWKNWNGRYPVNWICVELSTQTLYTLICNENTNYADQIVKNLEKKGESTDYINGFLQATINGLQHIGDEKILEYMKRSVEHSKQ